MQTFRSVDEVLDFAISREEESYAFYSDLAKKVTKPGMSDLFSQFADEERGHKQKLLGVKSGKSLVPSQKKITDLKMAEYLVDEKPGANMGYQEALILAMKKEKAAFRLYTDLAASAPDAGLKSTFLALAQEEAKHKLRFEIEYDDEILAEA